MAEFKMKVVSKSLVVDIANKKLILLNLLDNGQAIASLTVGFTEGSEVSWNFIMDKVKYYLDSTALKIIAGKDIRIATNVDATQAYYVKVFDNEILSLMPI